MEVIEDGNIMDRIPILLQRDLEYYQANQTVLSETICPSVVGGRLDFPRNASFASVKIVLWLEEEFTIAFKQGSGMFVTIEDEDNGGVAKTSDPDKFVQLAIKSSDSLLEHLHMLAQEALDHADLPVLTATLGAAALLKNTLFCYLQHAEDMASAESQSALQACYKRYMSMSEAVAERVLDLHNRVLSLYILQDSGGRPVEGSSHGPHYTGTPSVQGWWLYMNGSRKDLWNTVPPRMAQRIFAGMLNETLTILTVRYCQTHTNEATTKLLLNDILNILLCVAQLLPSICSNGSDLAGLEVKYQTRDVRDVHAKCNELFKCFVYRGADLHFINQAFKEQEENPVQTKDSPSPWFTFVSPRLFDTSFEDSAGAVGSTRLMSTATAVGLELTVLLDQPQPCWALLVKVLMMRNCHLARYLLSAGMRAACTDNQRWPSGGRWYYTRTPCTGSLCTADGHCVFQPDADPGVEYARAVGALTHILCMVGSKAELNSTLCYALEISGRDWASCLDKRQVWCDRRPAWLAGVLATIGTCLDYIPPVLVNAVRSAASIYQTMSLCLSCISRTLDCIPCCFVNACTVIECSLPSGVNPVGGSVMLQLIITRLYEEITNWAQKEAASEKAASTGNGEANQMKATPNRSKLKQVRIVSLGNTTTSSSVSFDGSQSTGSCIALAIAEALCSIDEDDKHTQQITQLVAQTKKTFVLSNMFGLEDFPEFAELFQEGDVPASNAERVGDAAALTTQILMSAPGRDSMRVIYDHIQLHADRIFKELGIQEESDNDVSLSKAPLLYIMFHIARRPFDQYLRGEWPLPWSKLVRRCRAWGAEGALVHVNRRSDVPRRQSRSSRRPLQPYGMLNSNAATEAPP